MIGILFFKVLVYGTKIMILWVLEVMFLCCLEGLRRGINNSALKQGYLMPSSYVTQSLILILSVGVNNVSKLRLKYILVLLIRLKTIVCCQFCHGCVCTSQYKATIMVHLVFICRPTGKFQTHWARGCFQVWISTKWFIPNIKRQGILLINILFININIIKLWHKKKTIWLTGAWGRTPWVVTSTGHNK